MQKLSVKLKNTPRNTPLVPCSVSSVLNRAERLSVQNKVLTDNNSEVDLRLPAGGPKAITPVFVLSRDGSPLMPCKPAKARHLVRDRRAKVIRRSPFTIQLLWDCEKNIQSVTLGIDPGYKNIGFSAVTDQKELISGEVKLRSNMSKKLADRSMYRRGRRIRFWYREPRFNNRVASKKKGWLAPSIRHKLDSHIKLVKQIKELLPISSVVVEVANFNIQKIKNPEVKGIEYQRGEQLGFWNVREYVLHRDNHTCQKCKGKSGDKILQVHHIKGKKEGATDRPEELITVCKTCHRRHHKGIDIIPIKEIKNFKPETFMSTIRWKLVDILKSEYTYGYITKHNRIGLGLAKSHSNDAFCIANGNEQLRVRSFSVVQKKKNNRRLQVDRKGYKPGIRRQRYPYQPYDLVKVQGNVFTSKGTSCYGTCILLKNQLDGVKSISTKKLDDWHISAKTLVWTN